ncbi:MAG: hypothetical protein ABJB47_18360, partial [Actinomycetota bacterium]
TLRVVGSAGIRLHCAGPGPLMDAMSRPAKDIDFVVPQQHRKAMRRFLEARGYVIDRDLLIAMEGRRYTFSHPEHGTDVDVFVERLEFCHTIEVAGQLGTHPVTIGLDELLLQKVQIIEMTTTDVIDTGVLLATHAVAGGTGTDLAGGDCGVAVDGTRVARLLAKDWGFHHTASRNLGRVRDRAGETGTDFGAAASPVVKARASQLLDLIDAEPKALAWRMRDRVGERKQWWQDVDDKEATY